jgi:hypothetical protein
MKERALVVVKPIAILLAVGFIYAIIRNFLGFGIPCPVYSIFHIYCPGCGITRMFLHLFKFHFYEAFSSNCVIFCMLPVAFVMYVRHCYIYIRYGKKSLSKLENILLWTAVAILIIFMVVRNIFPIDILVP